MKLNAQKAHFIKWLPWAVTITLICGLVYISGQQILRQSANDPQIQTAEDIATALQQGATASQIISGATIDIEATLSPFAAIFDNTGKVSATSVTIAGASPTLPAGVLASAQKTGEDRFTWAPESGAREAAVLVYYTAPAVSTSTPATSGYVLVGRSLREVELRENALLEIALIFWILSLIASFVGVLFLDIVVAMPRRQVVVDDSSTTL